MLIHTEQLEGTAVSGTFALNTPNMRGLCHNFVVKPETEITIWSIKIENAAAAVVYERTSETGTLSELISLPLRGIYTVTIYDSTVDEDFIIQFNVEE